jgi:hypothetical protein
MASAKKTKTKKAPRKVKAAKTTKEPKAPRAKKEPKAPRVKGELRDGTIASVVAGLWSRDKGASHKEALAVVMSKFPAKKEEALSNTLRGCVNSIPKATGRKLRKEKDEKRGTVYHLA